MHGMLIKTVILLQTESSTAIDREPLVQVLVKRGDKVVLDGYILIHITRQNPEVAPNKKIDLLTQDASV